MTTLDELKKEKAMLQDSLVEIDREIALVEQKGNETKKMLIDILKQECRLTRETSCDIVERLIASPNLSDVVDLLGSFEN